MITQVTNALQVAYDTIIFQGFATLEPLVNVASGLVETDYTATSWANFVESQTSGVTLYQAIVNSGVLAEFNQLAVTSGVIAQINESLNTGLEGLRLSGLETLSGLINVTTSGLIEAEYTNSTWTALQTARTSGTLLLDAVASSGALALYEGALITSGVLNTLINQIQSAYLSLDFASQADLDTTLNSVSGIVANSGFYTLETYLNFEVAYNSGISIQANITQSGILATLNGVSVTNSSITTIIADITTRSGLLEKEVIQQHLAFQFDAQDTISYSGVGTVWNNLSAANNITLSGVTFTSEYGGIMSFDGDDEAYIETAISAPNLFSIELWFKADQTENLNGNLIAFQENQSSTIGAHDRSLFLSGTYASATLNFYVFSNGSSNVLSSEPLTLTEWNHVVATFDYSNNSGLLHLYINGVLDTSGVLSGSLHTYASGFWRLGSSPSLNGQGFYEGDISEVRIYDVVLTPAQVAHNFEQSKDISEAAIFMLDANNLLSYSNPPSTVTLTSVEVNTTSGVFVFDGSDGGNINTGLNSFSGDFAIELWFNEANTSGLRPRALFSDEPLGGNNWNNRIFLTSDNKLVFDQRGPNSTSLDLEIASGLVINEWYHVVVIKSGNTIQTFFNGILSTSGNSVVYESSDQNILIGASAITADLDYEFIGQIGTVSYYDRALSSQEVLVNFNQSSSRFSND